MIKKDSIFASGGAQDPIKTEANFREGMIPNTVAMAEDVNTYGNMSDKDLWAVCREITNLLALYDVRVPNNLTGENDYEENAQFQLADLFENKLPGARLITGIDRATYTAAPVQTGNAIAFTAMDIVYNTDVYYGTTRSALHRTTLAAQTLTANSTWVDGVHFIYATTTAGSTISTLAHDVKPIEAKDGATKCFLGSVFVINGGFQSGTWKFQPWLQVTAVENRESPTAYTKGGFVSPAGGTTLQMGALQINDEGINFGENPLMPNIMNVEAKNPFTYKFLHPNYNPSVADLTAVDTTHLYNLTSGAWEEIPAEIVNDVNPHYIVLVPCITPAGQTLMIPAMSTKSGDLNYGQIFDSQEAAVNSIFSLPYALTNEDGSDVTERTIFLGQSLVVKVGATDFSDTTQYLSVGMLPQALADFTSASGQAGGGITTYRPMPTITWSGYSNVVCQNNAANVIIGSAAGVTVSAPTPNAGIINQLEIHYTHEDGFAGLVWNTNITWWTGVEPVWIVGTVYNIVLEYIQGKWYGGVLALGQ